MPRRNFTFDDHRLGKTDIDLTADPHPELAPEDFYKHIDAELVEPRRMKQLLVWCAKRAAPPPNKISVDGNAHAIGRYTYIHLIPCFSFFFAALVPAPNLYDL